MKIYITRHGQVCPKDFEGSVDFPTGDLPLSDLGQKQAVCLGKQLRALGFNGKIISSPYRRTMMTANLAAEECGAKIYLDGALREMFFSDEAGAAFNGMDMTALKKEFNHIAEDSTLPHPWWTTEEDRLEGIADRMKLFWDNILSEDAEELLVVCHGASVFGSMHYFNTKYNFGFPTVLPELGAFLATRNLNCNLSCIEIDKNYNLISARLFTTPHLSDALLTSNSNPRKRPEEVIF